MTDNDIVKALELCRANEKHSTCEHCSKCPFSTCDLVADEENCLDALYRRSINLISRKKTEIERLKKGWRADVVETANAKSEAIREFAELLKKNAQKFTEYDEGGWGCTVYAVKIEDIDNTVEEMTEDAV